MTLLRVSSPAVQGVYQGSKYLKYQVLCDEEELRALFQELEPFWIFPLTGLVDGKELSKEFFLKEYASWIEKMKRGEIPADAELRCLLACTFTAELDALWLQPVPGNRYLTKISKPALQVQAHFFTYSSVDGVFRPMSMGQGSIFWGLQFSFPQIYQDPKTMELREVEESANTELFQKVKLWVREKTRATPFLVGGHRINATIRIGKNCFSWIDAHSQLIAQKIGIFHAS